MTTVVTGIIDDGIAIGHERFRNASGRTRIKYAWLQDGTWTGATSSVPYGREITKNDIDSMLLNCTHGSLLDEDEFYRRVGWVELAKPGHKTITWRVAHGTHVMDLASGYNPAEDRDDRPIICVQLPAETTANTSQAAHSQRALDAMTYILDRADKVAYGQPVVINFSFGAFAGPHDGRSHVEAIIDELIAARKARFGNLALEVILPAGNGHLSRCHAEITFRTLGDMVPLEWRILPDDFSQSFMEIWLPIRNDGKKNDRLTLRITPPFGPQSPKIGEDPSNVYEWPQAKPVCFVEYAYYPVIDRGMFLITLEPTASLDPNAALAPAGTWRIELHNERLGPGQFVHAWIERDDTPYGYTHRGRQSYFDNACYRRFDNGGRPIEIDLNPACVIKRAGMINSIATGRHPIVVGGYMRREVRLARYTAGGPVDSRTGPDVVSVSEDSYVHRGVLAAGSRCGSVVTLNGTSVAAPQLARFIADRLAAGQVSDRATIAGLATPVASFPPERGGAGRIEIPPVVRHSRYWS